MLKIFLSKAKLGKVRVGVEIVVGQVVVLEYIRQVGVVVLVLNRYVYAVPSRHFKIH